LHGTVYAGPELDDEVASEDDEESLDDDDAEALDEEAELEEDEAPPIDPLDVALDELAWELVVALFEAPPPEDALVVVAPTPWPESLSEECVLPVAKLKSG
jgi:hypothetical protein